MDSTISPNPFEDLEKSGPVGNVFHQNFGELVVWWFGGHRASLSFFWFHM